jgi:adenosylcobyric acid synthase
MTAKTLMVVGTMSSAGKSLLVTALCRIFSRRGIRVAPFKAQNMSNNAAVCKDGGEIGRAQALQAMAAGIEPTVDMNPILLKPEADARSQVIVNGRVWETLSACDYYRHKNTLWEYVKNSLDRLIQNYDLVIIEGAGSAAEMNLKGTDIVNMAVARYAGTPVLLVGDIDRGGVFAQLLGTLWLLEEEERRLIRGLVVNKFRGDPALFTEGIKILEDRGHIPVLGVVPYLRGLNLPDEDAVPIEEYKQKQEGTLEETIDIAVMAFPRIANFDDFDPLKSETGVGIRYVHSVEEFGSPDAVILPGTKSTAADLQWLRKTGLAGAIRRHAQDGGAVVGICGGYQMLGNRIEDPDQLESNLTGMDGLGLLPGQTRFIAEKATYQVMAEIMGGPGWIKEIKGTILTGYEIHMGRTEMDIPWLKINHRNGSPADVLDGGTSKDGKVWGCYIHGLFANDGFRHAWLKSIGWQMQAIASQMVTFQASLDILADTVEASINMAELERIIWGQH